MIRSLWTSSTGMIAQQTAIDTITNNLSNANTTGFKVERDDFNSLLHQNIKSLNAGDALDRPLVKAGLGVRSAAISKDFSQGTFASSDNPHSFAIGGSAFFAVEGKDGETLYTRNGDFTFETKNGIATLKTTDGLPVLTETGGTIRLSEESFNPNRIYYDGFGGLYHPSDTVGGDEKIIYVDAGGNAIMYTDAWTGQDKPLPVQIGRYQFVNRQGLKQVGDTLFEATVSSGEAINEFNNPAVTQSTVYNGYLESSNIKVPNEMISIIAAQRTYDLNSKGVQTSDEMMQTANQIYKG